MKRNRQTRKAVSESPTEAAQQSPVLITSDEVPRPDWILEEAEREEPRRVLDEYWDAIRTLRDKRFTFREIAEWLGERGIQTDHNAIWRAYTKHMDDLAAHREQEADEDQERKDMGA